MASKWSDIWKLPKAERAAKIKAARFTPPSPPKSKSGGGYPHRQPFKKS
jgi:hypothetical protein